ncbi:hypothetical protein N0V93_007071 [Gnomoniopsis smithogilvyi]|uniref:Uncharacterized protein n=1 Tax=Gnomoniopsis smithogilvyi TaxID=1191159 RepID=A0A9W9CW93_9PEZI|nr:hypothetical protein N0V93_007071 [Gnomoniopsis smithogilvyi]
MSWFRRENEDESEPEHSGASAKVSSNPSITENPISPSTPNADDQNSLAPPPEVPTHLSSVEHILNLMPSVPFWISNPFGKREKQTEVVPSDDAEDYTSSWIHTLSSIFRRKGKSKAQPLLPIHSPVQHNICPIPPDSVVLVAVDQDHPPSYPPLPPSRDSSHPGDENPFPPPSSQIAAANSPATHQPLPEPSSSSASPNDETSPPTPPPQGPVHNLSSSNSSPTPTLSSGPGSVNSTTMGPVTPPSDPNSDPFALGGVGEIVDGDEEPYVDA